MVYTFSAGEKIPRNLLIGLVATGSILLFVQLLLVGILWLRGKFLDLASFRAWFLAWLRSRFGKEGDSAHEKGVYPETRVASNDSSNRLPQNGPTLSQYRAQMAHREAISITGSADGRQNTLWRLSSKRFIEAVQRWWMTVRTKSHLRLDRVDDVEDQRQLAVPSNPGTSSTEFRRTTTFLDQPIHQYHEPYYGALSENLWTSTSRSSLANVTAPAPTSRLSWSSPGTSHL